MKTILICLSRLENPVSNYFWNLGKEFEKRGYRAVLIFDGHYNKYPKISGNFKFYTWKNLRPVKIWDFLFFMRILQKEKPYICISNFGSTNIVSILSFLFKVKNRMNYIHTPLEAILNNYNDNFFAYHIISKYLKFRKKMIYRINTHLLTNSNGMKDNAIINFNVREIKTHVLPILINKSNIKYNTLSMREKCITIVAGLVPNKGHLELIKSFKFCVDLHPFLKLKIIGDGPLKNELKNLINQLMLVENVEFLGNLPNNDVRSILSKSLIGLSSSYDEAYGIVSLEALAEGTPIVCSRTYGSIDILKPGYNGLFFNVKNHKSLSESIDNIMSNWHFFSKNALLSFDESFNISNIYTHYKYIKNIT